MKRRLLRLCSIVLVISMVLGNLVSVAADTTESTDTTATSAGTTGIEFSTTLKGVVNSPFASDVKTLEATISLPTTVPEGATNYEGVIIGSYGEAGVLPSMSLSVNNSGYAYFFYHYKDDAGVTQTVKLFLNQSLKTGKTTHVAVVLTEDTETGNTIVTGYVNGFNKGFAPSSTAAGSACTDGKLPVSVVLPTNKFCVGGDHRTGNSSYFKGDIYTVAAYSGARSVYSELDALTDEEKEALTDEEISTMLAVDKSDTDLMAYYDLTTADGSTTTVENGSANDKNNTYALNIIETWMSTRRPALDEENIAYSIALVGDTQIATEYDVLKNQANENGVVAGIYQWILDNKEEKNIQFVVGLGDIVQGESKYAYYQGTDQYETETKTEDFQKQEWDYAMAQINKLKTAGIPYSLIRGNHDAQSNYIKYVTQADHGIDSAHALDETMLNTWQELVVGDIKYLILSLDLGASDTELKWAEEVIQTHPNHNVIITTHAYLDADGTTLNANDEHRPDKYDVNGKYSDDPHNRNNGDEMWDNYFKKYDNIVMIVSGHIGSDDIIMSKAEGTNGNEVAQLLVDPQSLDHRLSKAANTSAEAPTGMICLLNFSADGKTVQVEQYSTERGKWFMSTSQFTFDLNVVQEQKLLFNTQQMPRTTDARNWFAKDGTSYSLATYAEQAVVSENTTNVISYCAPSDGYIRITDMKVGFHDAHKTGVNSDGDALAFEFAVTNEEGKILSNQGHVLRFDSQRTLVENLSVDEYEIKKGESIHFVIHGNAGSGVLVQCVPNIEFRVDSGDDWECVSSLAELVPWPKDEGTTTWTDANATQGMGGFYYHYSISYKSVNDEEAHNDKLILSTKPMTYNAGTSWPFVSSTSSNCKTQIPQIIAGAGTTNVISYQADADGSIWIDEMRVWQVNAATGYQVDFAVVDETGKVLTNNGEIFAVPYSKTSEAKANLEALVMTKQEIKKGERIYFVFRGIEGTATSVRCSADIQFCAVGDTVGTRVNMGIDNTNGMSLRKSSSVTNANITQGAANGDFFYEYSTVYEKVEDKKPEYLHVTPTEMTDSFVSNNAVTFPFMQNSSCRTSYNQIVVGKGYTNIIAYKAPENGTVCIDTMKVWIATNAAGYEVEFSIINKDGEILTNNGKKYKAESVRVEPADDTTAAKTAANNAAYQQAQNAAENLILPKQYLEQGEPIYFVFHGINGTSSIRCNAKILFDKASDDKLNTFEQIQTEWHDSNMTLYSKENYKSGSATVDVSALQGTGNFYYMYSTQNASNPSGVTIGDETEGTVTIYETVKAGEAYGDKYITEIITNDDGTKSYSYIDLDMLNIKQQSKIQNVYNEETQTTEERTSVRFIASVDNLSYEKVGFLFTKNSEVAADLTQFTVESGKISDSANRPTTKVYTKLLEYDTYRKASNIYADDGCSTAYGFAFKMNKIPTNDGTIYVRAYVLLDDGETYVYGEPRAINITAPGIVN